MKQNLLLLVLFVMFFLTACTAQTRVKNPSYALMLKTMLTHSVPEVSIEEAEEMDNVILLDAREKDEYEVSHLEGATWIGYDDFDKERVAEIPKDARVLVYCSIGYRSEKISEQLVEMGFEDVSNLYGGIFEWSNSGKEVVDENGEPTKKVHAFDKVWGVWLDIPKENKVYLRK